MSVDRRHARVLAMQALCQWDVQRDASSDIPDDLPQTAEASNRTRGYADKLFHAYVERREEVDRRITDASRHWELDRISPVERNVMRVAIVEWLLEDVPPKVSLNEAIEIGREYGGESSPGFINGVLDEVLSHL